MSSPASGRDRGDQPRESRLITARRPADMDPSLVGGVATVVAPERSFCFFNAAYEVVLQMIARYFAFGHETPERRQILAHVKAVCADPARSGLNRATIPSRRRARPGEAGRFAGAEIQQVV
jgi:hypothetical protein